LQPRISKFAQAIGLFLGGRDSILQVIFIKKPAQKGEESERRR
jgi:hypothetical protein